MKRVSLRILAATGGSLAVAGFAITVLAYANDVRRAYSWGFYPAFVLRNTMSFYTPYLLATSLFVPGAYLLFSYAALTPSVARRSTQAVVDGAAKSLAVASAASTTFCLLAMAARAWSNQRITGSGLGPPWDPQSAWLSLATGLFLTAVFGVFCSAFCWKYMRLRRAVTG